MKRITARRLAVVLTGAVLSLGIGGALPMRVPYSADGMRHAMAEPDKPCNRENDGEEVIDADGTWKCQGQLGKWILIDPLVPIEP